MPTTRPNTAAEVKRTPYAAGRLFRRECTEHRQTSGRVLPADRGFDDLLRNEAARYGISIRSELAADIPNVIGDRVQLQQVLMNLLINGIDAMKEIERRT